MKSGFAASGKHGPPCGAHARSVNTQTWCMVPSYSGRSVGAACCKPTLQMLQAPKRKRHPKAAHSCSIRGRARWCPAPSPSIAASISARAVPAGTFSAGRVRQIAWRSGFTVAVVLDGAHRLAVAVALGYDAVHCELLPRGEAEGGYRYTEGQKWHSLY